MSQWTEKIRLCADEKFKIKNLLPVQQLIIHNIMESLFPEPDKDCYNRQLIILPTGTGKSVCFQIPATLIDTPTIIVYPLISLINDQYINLTKNGVASQKLVGGMSKEEIDAFKVALDRGACKCVLTNPETLSNAKYVSLLQKYHPRLIVIDEAHCISKWGTTFRASYLEIGKIIDSFRTNTRTTIEALSHKDKKLDELNCAQQEISVIAFTGTASEKVIADIKKHLFLGQNAYVFRGHANRENITYSSLYCINRNLCLAKILEKPKDNLALQHSPPKTSNPQTASRKTFDNTRSANLGMHPVYANLAPLLRPAIVFCRTRTHCSKVALFLRDSLQDENIFFYHAGLSKPEKEKIEDWFLKSDDGILVATCAYGMGVDKSNIRSVVHYEAPSDIENFLQETGRAGRDRRAAVSVVLDDFSLSLIPHDRAMPCRRATYMAALGLECETCTGCDVCLGYFPLFEHEYSYILDVLAKFPRCFDKTQLLTYCLKQRKKQWARQIAHTPILPFKHHHEHSLLTHAIQAMIHSSVIKTHRFLWKHKLSLSKDIANSR